MLEIVVYHQQQNLEPAFGTSKMHLSRPPLVKASVRSNVVVLLSMISTPIMGSYYCSMILSIALFIYLLTCLLTYLLTCLLTYLLTYLLEIDVRLKQFSLRRRLSSVGKTSAVLAVRLGNTLLNHRSPEGYSQTIEIHTIAERITNRYFASDSSEIRTGVEEVSS